MSTADILSEGEIDALMETVSTGDVPLETAPGQKACQLFDFSTREQSMLAQMPGLRSVLEKHTLLIAEGIVDLFKINVEVEAADIQVLKLEEVMVAMPERCAMNLVKVSPLNGISLLVLQGEMLSHLVNQFFGGSSNGATFKSANTVLTPTEKRINELLAQKFLATLEESWKDKLVLKTQLLKGEDNTNSTQIGAGYEQVLKFSFVVRASDWESSIDWVIPYAMLEPIKAKLGDGIVKAPSRSTSSWEGHFRQSLLSVSLELSGVYASQVASLAEVLSFKVGSIVPLKMPSEVILNVEGEPYGMGEHGSNQKKKSIKINQLFR